MDAIPALTYSHPAVTLFALNYSLHFTILCSVAGPGYATNVHSAALKPKHLRPSRPIRRLTKSNSCPPTSTCVIPEMVLWKSRGSRPATRNGGGRSHSVIEESKTGIEGPAGKSGLPTNSEDNPALHSIVSLPLEQDQQSVDSASTSRDWIKPQETDETHEEAGKPVQPHNVNRFSFMRFRNASDPQLSTTFATGNSSSPRTLPSKFSVL